jgi:hypothetical protein
MKLPRGKENGTPIVQIDRISHYKHTAVLIYGQARSTVGLQAIVRPEAQIQSKGHSPVIEHGPFNGFTEALLYLNLHDYILYVENSDV